MAEDERGIPCVSECGRVCSPLKGIMDMGSETIASIADFFRC
jgi:hypothetical protein